MGMVQEFKEFALKGNMVDMAVGIIIGGAFGTIVKSLVGDVMMPAIGYLSGGLDFGDSAFSLSKLENVSVKAVEAAKSGDVLVKYGSFLNAMIAFIIVALVLFMLIKMMNKAKEAMAKEEAAKEEEVSEPPAQEKLLEEIRDLLKK